MCATVLLMAGWPLHLVMGFPTSPRLELPAGGVVPLLTNDAVGVPPDESFAPSFGLHFTTGEGVRAALIRERDRDGEPALRARLLPLLDDPDRYAAGHLALLVTSSNVNGRIYEDAGVFDPTDLDGTTPAGWADRNFHFGLEWGYRKNAPADATVRPEETRRRLVRYWREYFAGLRNDFRVAPVHPLERDPRRYRTNPPAFRPADDPLPTWEVPGPGGDTGRGGSAPPP